VERWYLYRFGYCGFFSSSGNLAMPAAIFLTSSLVMKVRRAAADILRDNV
jgi:hypothetical protein